MEVTNVRRKGGIDKAGRMLTKDSFVKMTMEEGILDVELMDRPGMRSHDAEDNANGGRLDDWTKGLVMVESRLTSPGC